MKPRRIFSAARLSFPLASALVALFSAQTARAATYYWDVNGTTTGFSTLVGTWGTNLWNTDSAGFTAGTTTATPTSADDLRITAASTNTGTITVSGTQSASSITFLSGIGAVTISGGTSITIGGTGASSGIFQQDDTAQTVNSPLILNSAITAFSFSNTATAASGLLTIGGTVTGAASTGTQTITATSDNLASITLGGVIGDGGAGGNVALKVTNTSTGVTNSTALHTYSGVTTITAGILDATTFAAINTASGIGKGSSGGSAADLVLNGSAADGATLRHTAANVATTNRLFSVGTGGGTIDSSAASATHSLSFTGTGAMGFNSQLGSRTLTLAGSNTGANTLALAIANDGSNNATRINKTGTGTWILSGTNTYTGGTSVTAGALVFLNTNALSSSGTHAFAAGTTLGLGVATSGSFFTSGDIDQAFAGGTLTGNLSNVTVTATTNVGIDTSAGDFTYATSVAGNPTKGLLKSGANILTLTGTNTYTGSTTISAGTLKIDSAGSLGSGTYAGTILNNGAFTYSSSAAQTLSGVISGTGSLTKDTSATSNLTLSAANTFTGTTTVSAGTLTLSNALALQNSALVTTGAGFVTLSGVTTPTFGGLSGATGNLATVITNYNTVAGITLNPGTGVSNTYGGIIANGSGAIALTKNGLGTQILSGANTYAGLTTINAGTLQIGNSTSGSLNGTTGTALTFGGTGTFNVQKAAGVSQGMGTLTFSGGQGTVTSTWNNGAGSGNTTLTFSGMAARTAGATANFTLAGTGSSATNNKIVLTSTTNAPLNGSGSNNPGIFFGGTEYARYDTTTGSFRAVTYGTDTNAGVTTGGLQAAGSGGFTITTGASADVKLGGTLTGVVTGTLNTLNLNAASLTFTNAANILSVNGILSAGSNAAAINNTSTASKIQATALGNEIVIRVNGSSDVLTINQAIRNFGVDTGGTASALTKTGAGLLTLTADSTYTGATRINAGTLRISSAANLTSGGTTSTYSGAINVASGATFRYSSSATQTISGVFSGPGAILKDTSSSGVLNLSGNNTNFTGSITLSAGTLGLDNVNALGGATAISVTAGTIDASVSGISSSAPITLGTGAQTATIQLSSGTSSSITLGSIGGAGNLVLRNVTGGNPTQTFILNGASTYTGTTLLDSTAINASVELRLGVDNALSPFTVLTLDGGNGDGSGRSIGLDMNGFDQTLAGLTDTAVSLRTQYVSSSSAAVLTINGGGGNSFDGVIGYGGDNAISLVKSGAGTQTLTGANPYTGTTTVTGGILTLGDPLAIQNSALDTAGSILGDAFNGLKTGQTALTIGGLTGDKNFAATGGVFTTTSGGYSSVTTLTLNPGSGTPTYSGTIANGAAAMKLVKSGAGTQILTGSNSYTGSTTISAGILQLGNSTATGTLSTSSAIVNNATFRINRSNSVVQGTDFSGAAVTGTGAFNQAGAGVTTLNAANTYTGATTITGGTLKVGNAKALGFGGLQTTATNGTTVSSGFTLDLNGTTGINEPITLSGTGIGTNGALINSSGTPASIGNGIAGLAVAATGSGSGLSSPVTVAISGTGTGAAATESLGLTAASFGTPTVTGTVTSATVAITGGGGTGATATVTPTGVITITNPGTGYTSAPTITVTEVGGGSITYTPNATNFTVTALTLSNAGSGYTGTPTFTFNGSAATVTPTLSSVILAANSSIGGSGDMTIDAVVSQSGGTRNLTKVGGGTLTLTGTNSYGGTTLVSSGTLALSGSGAINTSSGITLNGSSAKFLQTSSVASTPAITHTLGTLTGNGTVGNVSVANSASNIISNNDGVAGAALTVGNLSLAGAAKLNLFSNSTSADLIVTGTLTTAGTPATLTANNAGGWTNGTAYTLMTFGGGSIAGSGDNFTKLINNLATRQNGTWNTTSSSITLTLSGDNPVWSGANGGTWIELVANSPLSGTPNWVLKTGLTATDFWASDIAEFNDTYDIGAGSVPVTQTAVSISAGNVSPTSTTFNNSVVNYTLGGGSGIATGTLTKTGSGTLTISTVNTYTGATTISGGTLIIDEGSIAGSSNIVNDAALEYKLNTNARAYANIISGNGTLTKSGTNTLTLSGANTFTGGLAIKAGTVIATTSTSALGGTTGTGAVTLGDTTGTAAASLLVGTTGLIYANPITLATNATVGTLTIGNTANIATATFSGGVNGNNALTINNSSSTAAARTITFQGANIAINGRITNIGTSTGATTISSTITSANTVGVTQNSAGSLVLSGTSNAYTGTTEIALGTLSVRSAGALSTSSVSMTGAATTLEFGTVSQTVTNAIDVTSAAAGALIYSDTQVTTLNGPITIAALTNFQGSGTANSLNTGLGGTITSSNNSSITISANNTGANTYAGAISIGSGSVSRSGAGNMALSNTGNSFSGGLNISATGTGAGTSQTGTTLITVGAQGSGDITFTSGNTAPITFTGAGTVANNILSAGAIPGAGGILKKDATVTTLSGANSYIGATVISAGTLKLGAAGDGTNTPLGTTAAGTTVSGTGTLDLAGFTLATAEALTLSGTGTSSSGALANSANSAATYGGLVTLGATGTSIVAGGGTGADIILSNVGTIFGTSTGFGLVLGGTATGSSIASIINGGISGTAGAGTLTKQGTGTWTLSGANSYTGGTLINQGTLQVDTGGTLGATTGALTLGSGVVATQSANSVGNLTLNTSATVGAIAVKSNTADTTTAGNIGLLSIASGSTLSATSFTAGIAATLGGAQNTFTALSTGSTPGAGGNLTVNGNLTISLASGDQTVASRADVDLSGLNTLNVTSTTSGFLRVGYGLTSRGLLTLANVANTINVNTLSVGDSNTGNSGGMSILTLGAGTNAISAPIINIGAGKAGGQIVFGGSSGSVVITGLNGAGTSAITIGVNSAGTASSGGTNSLLLAGHDATVSASTVIIGQKSTSSAGSGVLAGSVTFDTGTFTASSISMAGATSLTDSGSSGLVTGSFTVGGATANSAATGVMNIGGNLLLANLLSTTSTATAGGTLTINGGTVNVNVTTPTAGEGIFDTSVATAGTSTTTLNLQGGTLNLNGGVIGGTTGTGKRNITNLNFKSGTLQNVHQINGGADGLKKTTDGTVGGGTLILSGTNSFTGGVSINAGTLQLGSAGALLATAGSENAVTFDSGSTGTLAVAGNSVVVANLSTDAIPGTTFVQNANGANVSNATLTVGNATNLSGTYAGTLRDGTGGTGTLALTKAGTGTLTLSGANSYTGATTISAGTLQLGASNVIPDASAVTLGSAATAGTLDLAGFSDTIGTSAVATMLTLGTNSTTVGGLQNQVINSGGSAVLSVDGGIVYNAGALGFNNGKALISANLQLGVTSGVDRNFTVNDSSATVVDLEITGVVSSGTNDVGKTGSGTLFLNNDANTFTGQFVINNGTVQVTKLADASSNSSLGTGSDNSVIRLSDVSNATLEYVGATDSSTNRRFLLGTNTGASTVSTILNNGAGKLTFSESSFFNNTNTSTTARTLTLGGSNTLDNTISGGIRDNTGVGGTIALTKQDAGTWVLSGSNTYTGGTNVSAGTLVLSHNSAAGTGAIAVSGATSILQISSGVTLANATNDITVSNAGASVVRKVATTAAYNVGTAGDLASSIGGTNTIASILGGTNSSGTDATLTMSFSDTAPGGVTNDALRRSDIFTINGTTGSDLYVLQLTSSGVIADSTLGYNNGTFWDLAVTGNTGTNNAIPAMQNYAGAFSAFQASYGTTLSAYQGAYGIDTTTNSLWAVVNYGGTFTAVPEPTSALVGLLIGAGLLRRRRGGV